MKLTTQTRQPAPLELNMASLVDVVFLLLIFFMCTTSFHQAEERLPSPLPQKEAAGLADEAADFEPVRIAIIGSGNSVTLKVNDAFVADYAELERRLGRLKAIADVPTVIVPDDAVNFRHCVKVLDLCAKVGLDKVAFGG